MTKEPHPAPVPPDVPPIGSAAAAPPEDDTMPAQRVPVPAPVKPVLIGRRPRRRLSKGLVTAYFAGGLALLLVGVVTVFYLAVSLYGQNEPTTVVISRGAEPTLPPVPSDTPSIDPSGPLRARFGPQRLANGKKFVMRGEGDARFEVTVKAGKFRRSACDEYSVKPELGGYLPTELTVKVLEGEPEVTDYDFHFQQPDGTWLPSVGGTGCDRDYNSFGRRLVAGRTYRTTIVFGLPNTKGDIVFVYPLLDVVASWRVG